MQLQLDILTAMDVLMGGVDSFWPDLSLAGVSLIISRHKVIFLQEKKCDIDQRTDGPMNKAFWRK